MKKFILKGLLLMSLSVILTTYMMISIRNNWSLNSHEINVSLAYKRLDSLKSTNKIVVIAGSNSAFSTNSQIIYDSINMHVVNTSTHAGIGVRMQFEMYKKLLRYGDVVVFCPEYYSGKSRLYGEGALFRILSTHMPTAYKLMNIRQWCYTFKYIGEHFKSSVKSINNTIFEGPYSARSINKFGDIECEREYSGFNGVYTFKGNMDDETLSYYQYIHEFTIKNGIELIYLPPSLNESTYLFQKSQIDSLDLFMRNNHIPYQAAPERYIFADSLFFDTPYHMTSLGARLRTLILVEDIRRLLSK